MTAMRGMSRRTFFKWAGGGVVMLIGLDRLPAFAQDAKRIYPEDFNAYLVIGENGRVTVFSGKIEMGQGVLTSQAQMAAEELGVELASIDMVLGDTDKCPWDAGTYGSLTTRMFGPALRAAAAQARLTLMSLAAGRLGVSLAQLEVKNGIVSVIGEPQRKLSYGELSGGARIAHVVDKKAVLRAASEFSVMGQSPARLDGIEKVTGAAKYAADVRVPGMQYARILRPPTHGAILLRFDASGAESYPGATVVEDGELIAVLHPNPEAAGSALWRIKSEWQVPGALVNQENIFDYLVEQKVDQKVILEQGDLSAAHAGATKVFEATYRKGYVAHAPIETHAALADVRDGKATVWASTQTPFPTRDRIAQALGMKPQDVRMITPFVGGGFGGKSASAQAVEAARLSQLSGKPVQVAWTRNEEFFFDTFDPAAVAKISSGINGDGKITLWDYTIHAAGERGAALFYDVPNARIRIVGRTSFANETDGASVHPFAVGPWRAPGANMNVFAIESQIDMMAAAAGIDPVEFRLRNISDPRMRKVLQTAAEAFGWRDVTAGRGFGVACSRDAGTCVATMAEVKVNPSTGEIKVVRMVCAQDMGIVVNPVGAKMQIEGGLTMGLGYTLSEELRFRGGEIQTRNFSGYTIPHFSWVPRIDAVLVENNALAPQGGGEPSITTTGAVIANAVFNATGVRLARLPMTPDRVREAMIEKAVAKQSSAG